MKKLLVIVMLVVSVSMLLAGCGAKQKMEDKIAEKVMESALGVDMDIDGEEITLEGEEGSVTFGSSEWPDSDLAGRIPEFKDGKITSAISSEGYVFVIVEEVNEDDFKNYYEAIKSRYTEESYESKFEDTVSYSGKDSEGIAMIISYAVKDKTLSIQASQVEGEGGSSMEGSL